MECDGEKRQRNMVFLWGLGPIGLHLKNPGLREGAGRSRALSEADEEKLANCLRTLTKWGFGLTRESIQREVQQ